MLEEPGLTDTAAAGSLAGRAGEPNLSRILATFHGKRRSTRLSPSMHGPPNSRLQMLSAWLSQ